MNLFRFKILPLIISIPLVFSSCQPSYHEDYVEQSIKEICEVEYGITEVEVRIIGKTLGVYLSLDQLFSIDYEKFLSGELKETDIENLVQFDQDALSKVEDVLFSTSRVMLSTNREIDFYQLTATDTLGTGLQFSIIGNILDMKRVRFWDIPRSEYRKRLIHDISINQTVLWKRNIKKLFTDIPKMSLDKLLKTYMISPETFAENSQYFYQQISEAKTKEDLSYEVLDIRAKPLQENSVLVYAKVKETFTENDEVAADFRFENNFVGEYLFILTLTPEDFKISQVIPFFFIKEDGVVSNIDFPDHLQIYQNLDQWPDEFEFEEIFIEDFIAGQLTKRIQFLVLEDPDLQDKLIGWRQSGKLSVVYDEAMSSFEEVRDEGFFTLNLYIGLKDKLLLEIDDLSSNETLLYFLDKVFREMVRVIQAYSFNDYSYVEIQLPAAQTALILDRDDLKKFYKNKISVQELLFNGQRV